MTRIVIALLLFLAGSCIGAGGAGTDIGGTDIKTVRLQDGLYLFKGFGGNAVLLVGPDGALLVDDEYAELTAKLVAAIAAVTAQPVRYVINTHFHDDHTGGNEYFGRAGAIIIAQENAPAAHGLRPGDVTVRTAARLRAHRAAQDHFR